MKNNNKVIIAYILILLVLAIVFTIVTKDQAKYSLLEGIETSRGDAETTQS